MKRAVVAMVTLGVFVGCTATQPPPGRERIDDQGGVKGTLLLGGQELSDGFVQMVEWSPSEHQCQFPNDCGIDVRLLSAGAPWNPGRWIVVAPPVKGWIEPIPFDIMVRAGEVTTFEAKYRRATKPDVALEEGLFGQEEADFPIGLGVVFENIWRQVIDDKYVAVYAGSRADPDSFESTSDGVVLVMVIEPSTWGHEFFSVEAPIPGPIRITSVRGHRLTVVSPDGERAVFDADARQFLS